MQMVRVMVINVAEGRVVIDKETDFHTAEGRRYIAEHARMAMDNGDAVLTFPAGNGRQHANIARVLQAHFRPVTA